MIQIETLDLNFQEEKHSIGAFIIKTTEGPILIETGPMSTFNTLLKELKRVNVSFDDIKHVFLTHIHFDHAGAAWKFAENGAKIYVHEVGLPHLNNPEKLWNSAKQIYQDKMEILWGEMQPIASELLIPANDQDEFIIGDTTIKVHYTPGHAVHHNAYQVNDVIFTGDVAGVQVDKGPVVPPCPPPDIDIELWKKSIQKLRDLNPKKFYLTHFDVKNNPLEILDELEFVLDQWANFIKPYFDNNSNPSEIVPKFMEFTASNFRNAGLNDADIQTYEYANPSWMSVNGLLRYWKLKEQGRL